MPVVDQSSRAGIKLGMAAGNGLWMHNFKLASGCTHPDCAVSSRLCALSNKGRRQHEGLEQWNRRPHKGGVNDNKESMHMVIVPSSPGPRKQ